MSRVALMGRRSVHQYPRLAPNLGQKRARGPTRTMLPPVSRRVRFAVSRELLCRSSYDDRQCAPRKPWCAESQEP